MNAEVLFLIYGFVLICGACLTVWRYRMLRPRHLRMLLLLFAVTAIVEFTARYILVHPNHWWYNLFLPMEYLLFAGLYYFDFTSRGKQHIVLYGSAALVLFSVVNMLWLQGFEYFNTYTIMASGTLILIWIFMYFQELLQREEPTPLLRQPMFWISSGLLIFYLGNIFVAGTINYFIREDMEVAVLLLQFIKLLNIFTFSLFIVALLCQKPPERYLS